MKTVKEVSEITGISIRTLRYYDEIGLLKPSKLSDSGYRLYDSKALEKLQEIMFYKELGISLNDIKKIMDNPNYDKKQALLSQKAILKQKRNRLNGIIELIEDVLKGGNTMNFEAFNDQDIKKMIEIMKSNLSEDQFQALIQQQGANSAEEYEEILQKAFANEKVASDILRWYRNKEDFLQACKPIQNEETEQLKNDSDEIFEGFAKLMSSPDTEAENILVEKLADWFKNFMKLDNARAVLLDFVKELENEKFAEIYDSKYGKGVSKYVSEAIMRYYGV